MKTKIDNNNLKILVFILVMGILLGLLTSLNFLLVFVIGYGIIYTVLLTLLLNLYLILKYYEKYFRTEMTFKKTLLIGAPILLIMSIIIFLVTNFDYQGRVTHSYYRNGYLLWMMEESVRQFVPISLFFILVFAPVFRFIKNKKRDAAGGY